MQREVKKKQPQVSQHPENKVMFYKNSWICGKIFFCFILFVYILNMISSTDNSSGDVYTTVCKHVNKDV